MSDSIEFRFFALSSEIDAQCDFAGFFGLLENSILSHDEQQIR